MIPDTAVREALLVKAHELQKASAALGRIDRHVLASVRPLLRAMNSYYTNRIEGQHTLPTQLERALKQDFSPDEKIRQKQMLAIAHMQTEDWAEREYGGHDWRTLYRPEVCTALHTHLFGQLAPSARTQPDGRILEPGALRDRDVEVGRHIAPAFASVPLFLSRWNQEYSAVRDGELAIVAAAASHHRFTWIHPFEDGNGRVARLHTHLLLHALGLTRGVWSPLRAMARTHTQYYDMLAAADAPRAGDLDGRGNLSQAGLVVFIQYVLDICIDQAQFMHKMLDVDGVLERIAACLAFESQRAGSAIKMEALRPLHYMFMAGELDRGDFAAMTGLKPRAASSVLKGLLARGLVISDSPKGKVRFGTPLHALRFYFPALWPEAEADAAMQG
ncbi:MAG: Fic family protein [Burkholderiaceae bacterium]